jgi:hypothetical protein
VVSGFDTAIADGLSQYEYEVDVLTALTRFRVELGHLEDLLQLCERCSPGGLATYWTRSLEEPSWPRLAHIVHTKTAKCVGSQCTHHEHR